MKNRHYEIASKKALFYLPNIWDIIVFALIFIILILLGKAATTMTAPYALGKEIKIHLSPNYLPLYALYSICRMLIALFISLIFSLIIGNLCAKNLNAEKIIVPIIDILQSIPILGFQAISIVPFIILFPNNMLGPECAAIFAIFTSQAWNMTISVYQSIKMVPNDLLELSKVFNLSKWQKIWRIDFPFCIPSLIWNMMISASGGWFFVVACEALSINNQHIILPGIGSYIYLALIHQEIYPILYAIITMLLVIMLYDQLLFRPLIYWAEQFKLDPDLENNRTSWLIDILQHTKTAKYLSYLIISFFDKIINLKLFNFSKQEINTNKKSFDYSKYIITGLSILAILALISLISFIIKYISAEEILHVFFLGAITTLKVFILIILCSIIWLPIGVSIGLRPKLTQMIQPIIQFLAAFPVNLLFPIVVLTIVKYQLNVNIFTMPLMILGTQWYILFNIIAGISAIPKEIHYAVKNFSITGKLWWQKFALPAIFPYYVTGAMTAAGGAWNASIVAEVVQWGNTKLIATGIGSYITTQTTAGDFPRIALGITIMGLYVTLINKLLWQPLFNWSTQASGNN